MTSPQAADTTPDPYAHPGPAEPAAPPDPLDPPGPSGLAARTPLRIKLTAALIALLVLGLAVTGVAAYLVMRSYLLNQVDTALLAQAPGVGRSVWQATQNQPLTDFACPQTSGSPRLGDQPRPYFWQIANSTGELACGPNDGSARSTPTFPALTAGEAAAQRDTAFTVGSDTDQLWRTEVLVFADGSVVYVATSLDAVQNTTHRLLLIELLGGLATAVLMGAIGYVIVRRSLRPLVEVEEVAQDIAAGDLSRRVPALDARTEVGSLSHSFNTMLGQVEEAFHAQELSEAQARASEERMRRFVADASHELRTPLTSIRGFAELYRQGAVPDPVDIAKVMRRIEDQAARMGLLVEDLLLLARLDQQRPLELQPVDLVTIASEAAQDVRGMEHDRPVDVRVDGGGRPPVVLGDEMRLRQVVSNLVSNAVVHTPPATPITLSVTVEGTYGVLSVTDRGPGLSAEDAAHVFERFYRADASRNRTSGGSGLGLSIAAALVTAQSGTLTVDTAPSQGATFRMAVPLATAPAPDPSSLQARLS